MPFFVIFGTWTDIDFYQKMVYLDEERHLNRVWCTTLICWCSCFARKLAKKNSDVPFFGILYSGNFASTVDTLQSR